MLYVKHDFLKGLILCLLKLLFLEESLKGDLNENLGDLIYLRGDLIDLTGEIY